MDFCKIAIIWTIIGILLETLTYQVKELETNEERYFWVFFFELFLGWLYFFSGEFVFIIILIISYLILEIMEWSHNRKITADERKAKKMDKKAKNKALKKIKKAYGNIDKDILNR